MKILYLKNPRGQEIVMKKNKKEKKKRKKQIKKIKSKFQKRNRNQEIRNKID